MTRIPHRDGVEQIWAAIRALQASEQKRRGLANMLENATIGRGGLAIVDDATSARMFLSNGQLRIWDDYAANPNGFGLIYCDAESSANLLRWFPPHDAGTGLENSVTLRGTAPGVPGAFWVYTDGIASITSIGATYVTANGVFVSSSGNVVLDAGDRVYMDGANSIDLVTPKLRLYGLADTGLAPNLTLEVVGGEPIIRRSVSAVEKYKTDTAPLGVDIDDMLAYEPISWIHISTLDASPPGPIRRNVGHHAEAMDELPSLRQFVNYDEDGAPDSVEGIGFVAGLHQAWKHTHGRAVELEQQVVQLEQQVAEQASLIESLTERLEALETFS